MARHGANIAPNVDWTTVRPFADLKNVLRAPWGSVAAPWDVSVSLDKLNPSGYPITDFGGFAISAGDFGGPAAVSHNGDGTLTANGVSVGAGGPVVVQLKKGQPLQFAYTGNHPTTPTKISIIPQGVKATGSFTNDFLDMLRPFSAIRTMDWTCTPTWPGTTWASRSVPSGLQTFEGADKPTPGVCWEYIIELANTLKLKTLWVNVPTFADDSYLLELAKLFKTLDPAVELLVEFSNECWNGAQQPFHWISERLALTMPATDPNERVYQYVVSRLRKAWEAFGGRAKAVLAGQAVNPWWVECGLKYAVTTYGDAKWIDTLAYAGYAAIPENWPATANVSDVFAALASNLKEHPAWAKAYRDLANQYGVANVALYEAGQHLPGNNPLFVAAQDDPRMGDVYRVIAAAAGDVLICWYNSPGQYDASGCWGWGRTIDDDTVKRRAIFAMAGANPTPEPQPDPKPNPPPSVPGNGGDDTLPGGGGTTTESGSNIASVTFSTQFGDITIKPPSWMKVSATYK